MLLRIKTGTLFLQLLFLLLLVSGTHSARLFAAENSEDPALYHAEFSIPGISIKVPLDLEAMKSTAIAQLAVSFALLLPAHFLQNASLLRKRTTDAILQINSVTSFLSHRVLLYHIFRQWVYELLFTDPGWTPAAIPGATSEAFTTNPVLGYQTQIEAESHYQLQRENFGTLHSLVAYVSEMTQQLAPGQSTVRSDDWRAELDVLQQDASGLTLSVTLPDHDNSTRTFEVGSHSGIYWIKRFDGMNIERYLQIAWSEPEEGSNTTDLTIQLVGSMKSRESGVSIELTVPLWLSQRLLAANSAMAIAQFKRLFIGWCQSSFLAYEPVFKARSSRYPEADPEIKNTITPATVSDCLYCPDWKGKPVYLPDNVPESHIRKSPNSGTTSSRSGGSPLNQQSTIHKPNSLNKKAAGEPWRKEDKDDEEPPFRTDNKLPNYRATPKSLLWRATESFYFNSRMNGQASFVVTLQNIEDLVYTLSRAGMLQILPVEGVIRDQWPMVVSRRLARYINLSLPAQSASSYETGQDGGYTVKMTQAMFNKILERFNEFSEFASVIRQLQSNLEWIVASFCDEKKIESRFYGGWLARLFFLNNPLHHKDLHEGNLPITNDIDVLIAWPFEFVDSFKESVREKLEKSGFEISGFKQENLLFTFPEKNNENAPYMHSVLNFKGVKAWEKFNDYLPSLDVAMIQSERLSAFISEAEVISECVNRGLCFEARKRGTNTIRKEGKHWDRLLLLNEVFPGNIVFRSRLESIRLQVQNAELATKLDNYGKQIKSMSNHLNGKTEKLKQALKNIEYLSKLVSETEEERKATIKILQKQSKEKILQLTREINKKDNEIKNLSAKNEVIDKNESKLLKEIEGKTKKIESLLSDNKSLNSEILELSLNVQTLSANNENLKGEVSSLEKSLLMKDSEQVKLLAENQRLIDKFSESERYVNAGMEERAALSSKNEHLDEELSKLEQVIKTQNLEHTSLSSKNEHLSKELSKLEQVVKTQDSEYVSLSSEKEHLGDKVSMLEETLAAKDSEHIILSSENKQLNEEVAELKRIIQATVEENTKHKKKISTLKAKINQKPMDNVVPELKDKIKKLEGEQQVLREKKKELNNKIGSLQQIIKDLGVENIALKKYKNENSQPRNVDESFIKRSSRVKKIAEAQHKKAGVNTKPEPKGRTQYTHTRDNYARKVLLVFAAGYLGYKIRGFWGQAPADCEKISHLNIRLLCKGLDNDDGLNHDILQVLDELSEKHRVVNYRIFSVNLSQGSMNPLSQNALSKVGRKKEKLQDRRLLMLHSGHHQLGQMKKGQLVQILNGVRSAWIAGGQDGLFREIVSGVVDYCGLMPDEKWQEECSRQAVRRLLAKRSRAEKFVVVRGRDIKLKGQTRVIAFIPAWHVRDITSGQLEWHDVWPYRLDGKGYTILGSSKLVGQFTSECIGGDTKVNGKMFTGLNWVDLNPGNCERGKSISVTGSLDSVFWEHSQVKYDQQSVQSKDNMGTFYGAWEHKTP
ncbi:hypothetical protein NX722_26175 [Endozoicomonas gorgoniicola]|uniref:Uncharacterized protein n=1 Tax=Endozoicomonas gorgoniicola TaxID=1234144 RepID=A0ABT3N347_9GAMM|nr:hypothetical protein [Endozoicomonas gorgoniicola]MCW7556052.1 hypothetical protein [Endozoicomonas gorgoniicola]